MIFTSRAQAHFSVAHYLFPNDECEWPSGSLAPGDPVNVVGYGYGTGGTLFEYGNANDSRRQIHGHNDDWDEKGREGWFKMHGNSPKICEKGLFSMATGVALSSRWHVRLIPTYHASHASCSWCVGGELNYTTIMGAHYDQLVTCTKKILGTWNTRPAHIVPVDGFNDARRYLVYPMRDAGHDVRHIYWGNTRLRKHCTGLLSGSNGQVAFFKVNAPHHGSWGSDPP